MNGRIQELSKQAYELQRHKHGGYFTQQLLLDAFAELIVRECVGIITKRKNQAIDDSWNVDEAMSMAEMDLEEHFGVK